MPGPGSLSLSVAEALEWGTAWAVRPLHLLVTAPSWLFLAMLTAMLFRPPNVPMFPIDRLAFALLIFAVGIRGLLLRQSLFVSGPVSAPMLAMLLLALVGVLAEPYDAEAWSLFAAKWAVPFALYHLAGAAFHDEPTLRTLDFFCLLVLGYLCFIAIAFLAGARVLILPHFILDESLGYHADRARGPFLQAVANGVTLNILGLVALDSYRRGRLRGLWAGTLFVGLPFAILATKTRAVWLSFVASILVLLFRPCAPKVRRACLLLTFAGGLSLIAFLSVAQLDASFFDRLEERSPVEFRRVIYEAGWQMFLMKPFTGWGAVAMRAELGKRISEFHQEAFFFHNTFLEILVQYGLPGLGLYMWIIVDLLRLRRGGEKGSPKRVFQDGPFRMLWPIVLGVYLLNACFVVMNYQFVNAIFFTFAGLLNQRSNFNRNHSDAFGLRGAIEHE